MLRFLVVVYFFTLTTAIFFNDGLYQSSKLRPAHVLRLWGGQNCASSSRHFDPKAQINFTDGNNFQLRTTNCAVSEIDDSSTGESRNDSSNYDGATDLQEEFPNGFDPFRPGSAFLAELLEGPPLLGGELAKMITYDHKNEERLRYVTTTYNFALRWKKGRYDGQDNKTAPSIPVTKTEILATQTARQSLRAGAAEGKDDIKDSPFERGRE